MGTKNTTILLFVVALIVGAIIYLEKMSPSRSVGLPTNSYGSDVIQPVSVDKDAATAQSSKDRLEQKKSLYPVAKELVGPTGFINTPGNLPIKLQDLIGKKVILLDIWTYSCINCQRTLPYLKSWYEKYKDQGLEIIGLHVPEFEFEKDINNVSLAVKKFGITYPVVLDSNSSTARVYGMHYWPEEYLIDIDGFVVHKSVGEGNYDEKEQVIRQLLKERMTVLGISGEVKSVATKVPDAPVPVADSPETYFGSKRNNLLANGTPGINGDQNLILPTNFDRNSLYLGGAWNFSAEYAKNTSSKSTIVFKYSAKEVYFVASSLAGVKAKIYQDGILVTSAKGEDVDKNGAVVIKEDRLYKLIKNPAMEEHILKIEIENPGLEAYTFTFG